jgi:peptide/nickel transport system permease protein
MKDFWREFKRNKAGVLALAFIIFLGITAATADWVTSHDPLEPGVGRPFTPPSRDFPMGTDDLARDIFSGVVYGARVSLMVGLSAAATASLIGVLIGSVSGFFGGRIDYILMKLCEMFQSLPMFLFALVIVSFFGSSIWNIVIVIGFITWPRMARLVRAEILHLKEMEFVTAARAIGLDSVKIVLRHLLPNVLHVIVVTLSLDVGTAIIVEASLSFLGAGDPNVMSWGRMLHNAQRFIRRAWWMAVFPGLAIFLTVLSLNILGDALNDALNPRLRGKRG